MPWKGILNLLQAELVTCSDSGLKSAPSPKNFPPRTPAYCHKFRFEVPNSPHFLSSDCPGPHGKQVRPLLPFRSPIMLRNNPQLPSSRTFRVRDPHLFPENSGRLTVTLAADQARAATKALRDQSSSYGRREDWSRIMQSVSGA